jgi:hypothetical protein
LARVKHRVAERRGEAISAGVGFLNPTTSV